MPWLDLRTGYRCNNRCRFCDQGDRRERIPDAPLDTLLALLHRERAAGADAVWLAGGEITLRPDLPRLIEGARGAGYTRVGLQTNGRILAAAGAAERLRAAGLTDAVVALHGSTPGLHDWLVGAEGAHKQATIGIRRLVVAGVSTRANTVLTRSGTTDIPALASLVSRLGAEGHRWILARERGSAIPEARMLIPRLALVRDAVVAAIHGAWASRREAETVGLPLCVLGEARAAAADRLDSPATRRVSPPGLEEPVVETRYGPPCTGCALRAACPGLDAAYADRYGWDELGVAPPRSPPPVDTSFAALSAPGAPPARAGRAPASAVGWARTWSGGDPVPGPATPTERVILHVEAACVHSCPGCPTRAAYAGEWPTEPERALRRRLVRAASEGARTVVFAGASPWSHPGLPAVVREARRLGFAEIEVWGPIAPLDTLTTAQAERMAGLTRVRVPRLGPEAGASARSEAGLARLGELLPSCAVEAYDPTDTSPDYPMYQADGPRAVWASCQAAPPKIA